MHQTETKIRKVVLVGPDPVHAKGGMASVIDQITTAHFPGRYALSSYSSYYGGSMSSAEKRKYELKQLLHFLKDVRQYDIVHVNMTSKGSAFRKAWYVFISKIARKKVVIQVHCCEYFVEEYKKQNAWYRFIVKKALRMADAVLLLSENTRNEFENFFHLRTCIHFPNSIRLGRYTYKESVHGVVFAGKLSDDKGLSALILAMGQLKQHGISERLTVCGAPAADIACPDGHSCLKTPYGCTREGFGCYKALAALDDVDIEFTGWTDPDTLRQYLEDNAVMALPSKHEGAPVSILEAMASGCAVIGSPAGAMPEMIPDGIVLPYSEDIEKRLYELFSDPEKILKQARDNYQRVCEKYDEEKVLKKLAEVYDYVLQ